MSCSILIVDDDPVFCQLLGQTLRMAGYDVMTAGDGASALAQMGGARRPALVVLDVHLPDMSGLELAAQIKADPIWKSIRVMLISGVVGDDVHVHGLDSGADDFVHKPIRPEIVLARVRRQLEGKRVHDELEASRDQVALKNAELVRVERAKENLMHMLVHDLKSPLGALELGVDMLQKLHGDAVTDPLGSTTLQNIGACTTKLNSMVQNILIVAQMEQAGVRLQLGSVAFGPLLSANQAYYGSLASSRSQTWTLEIGSEGTTVVADVNLVSRVVDNLVSNACRMSRPGSDLLLIVEPAGDGVRVTVGDRGPGVPDDMRDRIFEKFVTGTDALRTHGVNQGLGLTFTKLAIEAHGGSIAVQSRAGGGSLFAFELPPEPACASVHESEERREEVCL